MKSRRRAFDLESLGPRAREFTRKLFLKSDARPRRATPLRAAALENRLLFSAAPIDPAMLPTDAMSSAEVQAPSDVLGSSDPSSFDGPSAAESVEQVSHEIVIVDAGVEKFEQLISELIDKSNEERRFDVYVLRGDQDGVEQISDILAGRSDVDAIHLVSHGEAGSIRLGSSLLSFDSLDGYAGSIASWNDALEDGGNLLLYGCDLAANDDGQALIEALGALCNCDVAASTDATGHADRGGDWDLEYSTGSIETEVAFTEYAQANWQGLLATNTFREGQSGYSSTVDTYIDGDNGNATHGTSDDLTVNDGRRESLIRFENLFSGAGGPIPVDAIIHSATLTLDVSGQLSGADISIYQMLTTWDENTSWNDLGSGVQLGSEALSTADSTVNGGSGTAVFDVTTSVQNWSFGDTNEGWVIKSDTGNDWKATSSEKSTASDRPLLSVTWSPIDLIVTNNSTINNGDTSDVASLLLNDGGDGISLEEAIEAANGTPGLTNIGFKLSGSNRINLTTGSLPDIVNPIGLYGMTDSDYSGTPVIEINGGNNAGIGFNLTSTASGSTIQGLSLMGFTDNVIQIDSSNNHTIQGNYIGTDSSGASASGGQKTGIYISNSSGNTIGGDEAGEGNVIVDQAYYGIELDGSGTTNNDILGNYIGVGADGSTGRGNLLSGILIGGDASNNTIGGLTTGSRNVIADNGDHGIQITGGSTTGNVVIGNYVGLAADGNTSLGNLDDGINIDNSANNNTIGGTSTAARNVISGNGNALNDHGIHILNASHSNTIAGNYIGLNAAGTATVGNFEDGIQIFGSDNNVIGGLTASARNVVSGNNDDGITVFSSTGTEIYNNYVGTNAAGTVAAGFGNTSAGILLIDATNSIVGAVGDGNVVGGSGLAGIKVSGTASTGIQIQGNSVGTDATGTLNLGNGATGIRFYDFHGGFSYGDPSGNLVGGTSVGEGNIVANNGGNGIRVQTGVDIAIVGNEIRDNGGLGIDLSNNSSPEVIDAGDGDLGANNLQNFPSIDSALVSADGRDLTIQFDLNSESGKDYRVEFFQNRLSGQNGEGDRYLGFIDVTTNGSGNVIDQIVMFSSMATPLVAGDHITATATEKSGASLLSTSEFSANQITGFKPSLSLPGSTINYDETDAFVLIGTGSTVTDEDSSDFNGGELRVSLTSGGTADDRLSIRNEGTGLGEISVSGGVVRYSNQIIGTVSGGGGVGDPLVIDFTTVNASEAAVQALVQNITFSNVSELPSTTTRTVQFLVTDDQNLVSDADTRNITVDSINDDPVNVGTFPVAKPLLLEEGSTSLSFSNIDLQDVDANGDAIRLILSTTNGSTVGVASGGGVTSSGTGTTLTLDGTVANLNAFLDSNTITFTGANNLEGTDADTVTVQVNDLGNNGSGGGGNILVGSLNVDITNANDEESLQPTSTLTLAQGATSTITNSLLLTTDADNTPAELTYTVTSGPTHGTILVGGFANSTFTQADIDAGQVEYQNNGTANSSDLFTFNVNDGAGTTSGGVFNIVIDPNVITVTNTSDVVNGVITSSGQLIENDGGDGISLREAIVASNNTTADIQIILPTGLYSLTSGTGDSLGDLDIRDGVTITGSDARNTIIDASLASDRAFHILSGTVSMSGLTVQGGSESLGAGIRTASGTDLTLTDVTIKNNVAGSQGGGIYNDSNITLERVTISGNSAGEGGGIQFVNGSSGILRNVTVSGNSATFEGSAIRAHSSTPIIINSTIAFNVTSVALAEQGAANFDLRNTILSNNAAGNTENPITSSGYNVTDGSAAATFAVVNNDFVLANPDLDPTLANNGGQTDTHALQGGGPAIDPVGPTGSPSVDQRGETRDANPDIGAYEFGGGNAAPTVDLDSNDSGGAGGNDYQITFTEGGSAVAIADSDVDVADDGTTFDKVGLSITGILDGNDEQLLLDGDVFQLATAELGRDTTSLYHVAVSVGAGTANLTISKQGGGLFSETEVETLIESIQYQHTDSLDPTDGNRLIDVTVNDAVRDSVAARSTINVNPENDAPTLNAGTAAAIDEDEIDSAGTLVSTIFAGQFSDPDSGSSLSGIAVFGNNANSGTEGVWQYASDGSTWRDIGAVDPTSALTISAGSSIRFVPVTDFTGSPTALDVRGLDDTHTVFSTTPTAEVRQTLNVTSPGGTTAISDPATTLGITVTPNASPVIGGSVSFQAVDDNATRLIFSGVTITDAENDNVTVTIMQSGGDTNGQFTSASLIASGFSKIAAGQYELTGATPAAAQAAIRLLEFDPTENQVSVGSPTVNTAFSIVVADASDVSIDGFTTVNASSINDSPTLDAGTLPSIDENEFNSTGELVSTIFAGLFSDADISSSFSGIAVFGNAANPVTEGVWQYASDGTTWRDIATVSTTNALAIDAGSRIRFVPVSGFVGTPTALDVRGLDETFSTFSSTPTSEIRQTINVTSPGGISGISDPATDISIDVVDNAVPVIGSTVTGQVLNDNATGFVFSGVTITDAENDNVSITITIPAGDANGIFTVASRLASGFTKTGAGQYSLSSTTPAAAQAAIRLLEFDPTENQVAVGSPPVNTLFSINISDSIGVGGNVASVNVTSINDSPTLNSGTLPTINENDFTSTGEQVSVIFAGQFADVDFGSSLSGIAVFGNSANPITEGVWQYASDGTTWRNIGTVSTTSALAIDAGSRIRFVPVTNFTGNPTALDVRGLDETHTTFSTTSTSEVRQTINVTSPGGTSGISDPAADISITVSNNADPVIGSTVGGQVVNDNATRLPFSGVTITDAENDNVSIVVTLSGGDANGIFTVASRLASGFVKTGAGQYTLASTTPAAAQAAIRLLEFDPTENQVAVGSPAVTTTFTIDVSDVVGGASDSDTTVDATAINDSPTLGAGALPNINENDFTSTGEQISVTFAGQFADPDFGSSFSGIAVFGNSANPVTEGVWQYASDGTTWRDIGTVSAANALAIDAGSRIRFVPVAGFTGNPTELNIRGLDETFTVFSTTPTAEVRQTINVTSPGGTSGISDPSTDISINVVNNAVPVIGSTVGGQAVNDNATRLPFGGVTITDAENDNVSVVVTLSGGDSNGIFTVASRLASGFTNTGVGQYTLTSTTPAAAQAAIRLLEFDPTENQVAVGSPAVTTTFTIDVNDGIGTASNSGTTVDVTSVNDSPTLNAGTLPNISENDFTSTGEQVSAIFAGQFSDPDFGSSFSGIAVFSNNANPVTEGVWQYASDGTTWRDIGTVSAANALAIDAGARIRFVPVAGYSGNPTPLSVRGLDDTHTAFSTTPTAEVRQTINVSGPGGTTGISNPSTTVSITVTGVNQSPVNTVPGTQTVMQATPTAITGISVSDPDAGGASITTRLQVSDGTLLVALSGSASISSGTNGSMDLTILGSAADINATLASLQYTGNPLAAGTAADSLQVTTNDLGNSGSGGALVDIDSIQIDITATLNTPPIVTAPPALIVLEDTAVVVTGLAVADADAGANNIQLALSVSSGRITVDGGVIGGVNAIAGNGSGSVVLTGTVLEINTTLASGSGVVYLGNLNFNGADTLVVTANDLGNTGGGPAGTDTQNVAITVNPDNDAPQANADSYAVVGSDGFTSATGVLANDTDVDSGALTAILVTPPANGTLILNADGTFTYTPGASFAGTDTFTYVADDGGLTSGPVTVSLVVAAPPPTTDPPTDPVDPDPPTDVDPPVDPDPDPNTDPTPTNVNPSSTTPDPTLELPVITVQTPDLVPIVQRTLVEEVANRTFIGLPKYVHREIHAKITGRDAFRVDQLALSDIAFAIEEGLFWRALDQMNDQIDEKMDLPDVVFSGTIAISSALSVGYVVWLVKGGHILAGMLAQVPAWRLIDPIPILADLDDEEDDIEDDSLQSLMEQDEQTTEAPTSDGADGAVVEDVT